MAKIIDNSIKAQLKNGDKLVRRVAMAIPQGTTKVNTYTVTSTRKAPKGLRVHAIDEFGTGVSDINFEYVPQWANIISIEWELL